MTPCNTCNPNNPMFFSRDVSSIKMEKESQFEKKRSVEFQVYDFLGRFLFVGQGHKRGIYIQPYCDVHGT